MTALEFINRFFKVRRCIACQEVLDYEHIDKPMCERCRLRWNRIVREECPRCRAAACECTCMPSVLSKTGALCLRRLMFYKANNAYRTESGVLFIHKHMKNKRVLEFLAPQLSHAISEELSVLGTANDRVMITFVPRSKRSYREYGFDQSEALSALLSEKLGVEHKRVFDTTLRARRQKELNASQRMTNAKKNIVLKDAEGVDGRYVVLIDDIVTTGAGMSVCVEQLKAAGARGVLCFCIASKM